MAEVIDQVEDVDPSLGVAALQPGGPYQCLLCDHEPFPTRARAGAHYKGKHFRDASVRLNWEAIDPESEAPSEGTQRAYDASVADEPTYDRSDGETVISLSSTARAALVAQTRDSILGISGGVVGLTPLTATGFALQRRAERLAIQLVVVAERNPVFMRWLRRFNATMAGGELGKLGLEVVLAVTYDVGAIRPEKVVTMGPIAVPGAMLLEPIKLDIAEAEQYRAEVAAMLAAQRGQAA